MEKRLLPGKAWLPAAAAFLLPFLSFAQVEPGWIKRYTGSAAASADGACALVVDPSERVYATGESGGDIVTIRYNNSDGARIWTKTFNGTGKGSDKATAIATDAAGNVYVTGESLGSGSGVDFITIKYNKDGSQKWAKRYTGAGSNFDGATDIAVDASGNVYVTGVTKTGSSFYSQDYLTIKYDKDGNRKWVKTYNSSANGSDAARALAVDASGNVYVTGKINEVPDEDNVRTGDFGTIKYNSRGDRKWVAVYSVGNAGANDIAVDGSGNVYVTGFSGAGDEDPDNKYVTVKYNSSGEQKWASVYDGPGNENGDIPHALALDGGGNVYVTGYSEVSFMASDYATLKYNNNGMQQWVARYNGPGNDRDEAFDLAVDGSGNVYVTGLSLGSGTQYDYATIKYNTQGAQQWVHRFNGTDNKIDQGRSIALDDDGNVFVAGTSAGLGTGNDFLVMKLKQTPVTVKSTPYLELNNLVVVYRHTNGGDIPDNYATGLHQALDASRLFYWRHSHMGLNIKWTVYVINDYLNRVHEHGYVFPSEVDADLRSRGFTAGTYDAVVAVVRGGGAYAWGANLVLGKGGYCQVPWWEDKLLFPWFFVHEYHHVVDALFAGSGHPEYPHNHPGAARALGEFVPRSGTDWDLNREILKSWQRVKWFDLRANGNWGTNKTFADNDQDTVPDKDAGLPLDEARLGSDVSRADTDGDGLSDLQEAMTGIFTAGNLLNGDSDGDRLTDASDPEPVYPLATKVAAGSNFTLEQDVTAWPLSGHYFFDKPDGASASLHLGYSEDHLAVGFRIPSSLRQVQVYIDADNDGLFHGNDNIEVILNNNTITAVNHYDAAAVPAGNHSDFIVSSLPVTGFSGVSRAGSGWSSYQLMIPRLSQYGLDLAAGESLGIYINAEGYGTMLEPNDFLSVALGKGLNSVTKRGAYNAGGAPAENNKEPVQLNATAFPSPFTRAFTLQWSGGNGPVSISITDALGRLVEKRTNLPGTGTIYSGHNLRTGLYYALLVQGDQKAVVKLIKN